MKIMVTCTPREGVDPAIEFAPHVADEMAALRALLTEGPLTEAYSPGRPGAVLFFEGTVAEVAAVVAALPLVRAGLLETDIVELQPFAQL